jgi:glycosyltransferase involved in cell wall biosynthesis
LKIFNFVGSAFAAEKLLGEVYEADLASGFAPITVAPLEIDSRFVGDTKVFLDCPLGRSFKPLTVLQFFRWISQFNKTYPDAIVHFHTPLVSMLGRVYYLWLWIFFGDRRTRIFVTVRGYWVTRDSYWITKAVFFLIEFFLLFRTNEVFFQSEEDWRKSCCLFRAQSRKFHLIRSACDDRYFRPKEKLSADLKREIVFVGRTVKEKGLVELLSAVEKLKRNYPDVKLQIVGSSLQSDRGRLDIDSLIGDYGLTGNVVQNGFVEDPSDVLVGENVVFCLPSYREGLPRSLLEARARKCFCVVSDVRGCREIIESGVSGLIVKPRDVSSLFVALDEALSMNPELYDDMRTSDYRKFKARYRKSLVIARYAKQFSKYS